MHIKKFNEGKKELEKKKKSNREVQLNLYNHLTEKEIKLLILLLDDLSDNRADMTCNDPYRKEERIFTKEEKNEMLKLISKSGEIEEEDLENIDGCLANFHYPQYLMLKLKSQIP